MMLVDGRCACRDDLPGTKNYRRISEAPQARYWNVCNARISEENYTSNHAEENRDEKHRLRCCLCRVIVPNLITSASILQGLPMIPHFLTLNSQVHHRPCTSQRAHRRHQSDTPAKATRLIENLVTTKDHVLPNEKQCAGTEAESRCVEASGDGEVRSPVFGDRRGAAAKERMRICISFGISKKRGDIFEMVIGGCQL